MPSSPRLPDSSEISEQPTHPSQAAELSGMDTEQMFRLIDGILPFEACLYYQFLPLALEGKYLKLGMVEPHDSSALDYARNILAYLNCSLKTEQITTKTHQLMLSAYLNHSQTAKPTQKRVSKPKKKVPPAQLPTLILEDSDPPAVSDSPTTETPASVPTKAVSCTPIDVSLVSSQKRPDGEASMAATLGETTLPLEVAAIHLSEPMEFLATLPPDRLLQELLGRVLMGGIGRLYFERQPDSGRILWSQDGILQSVLETLSVSLFQDLIIELKRLVNLPLHPVVQPQKVEIERQYQDECLLLRLQVMPGAHGEEATLQVLRGAALKFYQRKKLEKLGQESLNLAYVLRRKLKEMRDRSFRYALPIEEQPDLKQLLKCLDQQIDCINEFPVNPQSES
jgi:type II secretory ATPase GspE/PulE/Tfp pilus assembly ATPase PilB-like protein